MAAPHTLTSRIQALALAEYGVPVHKVSQLTTISVRHIYRLRKTARERGFDPKVSTVLKEEYVKDAPRPGRPKKVKVGKEYGEKDKDSMERREKGEDAMQNISMQIDSGPSLPDGQHPVMGIAQLAMDTTA